MPKAIDDEPAHYNNLGKVGQDEKGKMSLKYYIANRK